MNISANTNNSYKQNFTAQLKGPAIRSAINKSKDVYEMAELKEILDNVKQYGDLTTEIFCENTGAVTVSNSKFGNVVNKFFVKLNEKSDNPFLEMLRKFNTTNSIIKCEIDLIENRFSHTKEHSKKSLYDLYKSHKLSITTKAALDNVAVRHGVITNTNSNKNINLETIKNILFGDYLK